MKFGSRLIRISFSIEIMIAISKWKSLTDFKTKIGIRFWSQNRGSIFVRKSDPDLTLRLCCRCSNRFSIADRFQNENRGSILIWKSVIDSGMKIDLQFFRKDFWSRSWSRWTFSNQGLMKIFQSKSAWKFSIRVCWKKLSSCALVHRNRSRRTVASLHQFSIKVCSKFFNQGLLKNFQARSG